MLNTGGGLFNQQTPGAGLFNTGANQLGATGGNQLGGGLFNNSAGASGGLFATQTPQNQQQPGKMFNLGAQTTGGLGAGGGGLGGGLFNTPQLGGGGLGTGGLGTGGLKLGTQGGLGAGGGLFNTPLGAGNTGGLFNQQQQQQQQTGLGGGLFSQQNAGGAGGLFTGGGLSGLGNTAVNGTTIKFEAPQGNDTVVRNGTNQNVVTKLQCVCAMKQYENYSMEELRWADYQAGRTKGNQGIGTGMGTGTGLGNKLGGGLFNQGQQTATGGGGLFSQNKMGTGLNTGTGGLFNQQQQQGLGGGLFNQQQAGGTGTGLFNQTAAGGLGGGLGTGATGGLFNQQQQQGTGLGGGLSLFNNAATTGGLGAASGGLFNTQNTIGTGLGQQTTGGLFNTSKANTLGGGLNLGGLGGLGNSLGGGLGLGNKAGGLQLGGLNPGLKTDGLKGIGQQQPTSLGLGLGLGQPNQPKLGLGLGGGLGGTGLTGGLGTGTGLGTGLGSNLGTGLGGGAKLALGGLGPGGGGLGTTLGAGVQSGGFSDIAALQQQAQLQQQLQVLATSPFGDSPLFRTSLKEAASSTPPSKPELSKAAGKPDFNASSHYKLNMRRGAKLPFKAQSLSSPSRHMDKSLMFEGLDDLETSGNADTFKPRKNIKKLVIQPSSSRPTPTIPDTTVITNEACTTTTTITPPSSLKTSSNKGTPHPATATPTMSVITPPSAGNKSLTTPPSSASVESPSLVIGNLYSNSVMKPVARHPTSQLDNTMLAFSEPHPSDVEQPSTSSPTPPPIIQSAGPSGVLNTRSDYYTIPPVDELDSMATDCDPVDVDNFTIGRHGYGVIVFPGKTNVRDLNLDELVYIGHKEVAVYQDDSCKPPQGEGLNKRAIITLENTWPLDKTKREPIRDPERLQEMRYAEKVQHSTTKIGARFKEYRPETGSWIFEVDHFSKYKLQENASDDEGDQQQTTQPKQQQQSQQLPPPMRDTTDKTTSKPVTSTAMIIDDSSEDDHMSDGDVEQPLRESPAHEMDAAAPPHSYKLAASMGVSSHKVQVMKASFFTQQAPPTSHPRSPYSPAVQSRNLFSGSSNVSHRESPIVAGSGITHSPLFKPFTSSTAQQHVQQQQEESPPFSLLSPSVPEPLSSPVLSSATVPEGLQPLSQLPDLVRDSYFANGQINDFGLAFGRSFTTGWGPHWRFAHFGPPVGTRRVHHQKSSGLLRGLGVQKHVYPTLGPDDVVPFNVTLERMQPSPYLCPEALGNKTLPEMYTPLLAVQLQHSDVGGADVPHITPMKGNKALLDYAAIPDGLHMSNCADKFAGQYMKCVWSLAMALWGDLPDETNLPGVDNPLSYGHQLARKDQVTQWLKTVCGQKIEKELSSSSKGSELVYLKSLFGMVSSGHFREACQLARKHRDFRLTLLLAQCGRGSAITRDLLKKQLTVWNKIRADSFVTSERLRVYILLAGFILWETEEQLLSSCEEVEWQRNLAIHLQYCCSPTATIADVLNHYSDAMNDPQVSSHVVQPLPVYRTGQTSDNLTELHDICYHLLQLYCDRSHDLSQLINPATFTPCVLDYRLIWHLFQCLVSLDYTHISPNMLAHLHTSYAAQLENAGLWQWAVFVALHMEDAKRRTKMVQDILSRHCSSDITLTDHERFVTHQLHVSTELVYEAKALRSRYDGKVKEQVWNLIKAQQWNASHEVIMSQLAARAIVNGHTETLRKMLSCLVEDDHSNYIMDWDHQGSIVFDFLDITTTVTELQSSDIQQHELENLATGISDLCQRIPHLPFHSPLEMLCQAEMSKRALNYNKIVSDALQALTGQPGQSNLDYLPTMPLANDDVITEYRSQANSFIAQLNT